MMMKKMKKMMMIMMMMRRHLFIIVNYYYYRRISTVFRYVNCHGNPKTDRSNRYYEIVQVHSGILTIDFPVWGEEGRGTLA